MKWLLGTHEMVAANTNDKLKSWRCVQDGDHEHYMRENALERAGVSAVAMHAQTGGKADWNPEVKNNAHSLIEMDKHAKRWLDIAGVDGKTFLQP